MKVNNMKELIEKLNNLKITQTSIDWQDDIPEDIWEEFLKKAKYVDGGLDIDKHRWYELATDVYKVEDKYLGIRKINDLFSEQSSCEDMYHTLEFFEMEPVETSSYRRKE